MQNNSETKRKIFYLASSYGFSPQWNEKLMPDFVNALESLGAEVWEPFKRNNQVDFTQPGWAYDVGQNDVNDVMGADAIFAILNGTPPDEGVMVELGIAIALKKKIFLFRDDKRKCTESEKYPVNLMVFAGLPKDGWEDFYYTRIEDITDPKRPIARWMKGEL